MRIHLYQERKPAPFSTASLFLTLVCFQRWSNFSRRALNAIFYTNENSPPTPFTAYIVKRIFVQSLSTHCSSLDIHRYYLHETQKLAMWRRKLIKQQTPNISSTRDLVDKSLPCSSPPPPQTTGKNPSQRTAHFVKYMIASPLYCVYMREMLQ